LDCNSLELFESVSPKGFTVVNILV
jgi:hypothetical protein